MSRNRPSSTRSGRPDGWEPLRPAVRVQQTPERIAALRAHGAGDDLIQEIEGAEIWMNNIYTVVVSRLDDGNVQQLSIRRNDRKPITDWRHKQRIKTEIAGPEIEAIELYPAESRLMDTANQTYLFALPPGMRFPVGYQGPRLTRDTDDATAFGAVQRPLPDDWKG